MFGPRHYVPILRWKRAEQIALRELRAEDRARISPLIEIPRKIFEARKKSEKKEQAPEPARLFVAAEAQAPDPGQVLLDAAHSLLEALAILSVFSRPLPPRWSDPAGTRHKASLGVLG
jgi:hypothetical protein